MRKTLAWGALIFLFAVTTVFKYFFPVWMGFLLHINLLKSGYSEVFSLVAGAMLWFVLYKGLGAWFNFLNR